MSVSEALTSLFETLRPCPPLCSHTDVVLGCRVDKHRPVFTLANAGGNDVCSLLLLDVGMLSTVAGGLRPTFMAALGASGSVMDSCCHKKTAIVAPIRCRSDRSVCAVIARQSNACALVRDSVVGVEEARQRTGLRTRTLKHPPQGSSQRYSTARRLDALQGPLVAECEARDVFID